MKAGRNDPCPCGSGKKYKRCCLAKDRSRQAENRFEPAQPRWDETHEDIELAAAGSSGRAAEPVDAELAAATSADADGPGDDERADEPEAEPDPLGEAREALWEGASFKALVYASRDASFWWDISNALAR